MSDPHKNYDRPRVKRAAPALRQAGQDFEVGRLGQVTAPSVTLPQVQVVRLAVGKTDI